MWDYTERKQTTVFRSNAGASALVWASRTVDDTGRTLCCGYNDGVLRVLQRCKVPCT